MFSSSDRNLLKDNYDSHTKKEYVKYRMPCGNDPFPGKVQPFTSGFAHNLPRTVPTSRQVIIYYRIIVPASVTDSL